MIAGAQQYRAWHKTDKVLVDVTNIVWVGDTWSTITGGAYSDAPVGDFIILLHLGADADGTPLYEGCLFRKIVSEEGERTLSRRVYYAQKSGLAYRIYEVGPNSSFRPASNPDFTRAVIFGDIFNDKLVMNVMENFRQVGDLWTYWDDLTTQEQNTLKAAAQIIAGNKP